MAVTVTEKKRPYDISEELGIITDENSSYQKKDVPYTPMITFPLEQEQYTKPSNQYNYSSYGDYSRLENEMTTYGIQTNALGQLLSYVVINGEAAGSSVIREGVEGSNSLNDMAEVTSTHYVNSDVNFNGDALHDAILVLSSSKGNNILFTVDNLIHWTEYIINDNKTKIFENENRINECINLIENYQHTLQHSLDSEQIESINSTISNLDSEIEELKRINEALLKDNETLEKQREEYLVDLVVFQELAKTLNNIYLKTQSAEEALADLFNGVYGSLANTTTFKGLDYNIYSFSQKGYDDNGKLNPWDYFQSGWDKEIKESGCGPTSLASCLATMLQSPAIIPSVLTSSLTDSKDNADWKFLKTIDVLNEQNHLGIYYSQGEYGKSMKDSSGNYALKTFLNDGGKVIFTLQEDDGGHYMSMLGSTEEGNVIICDSQGGKYYQTPDGKWEQSKAGIPFEVTFDFVMDWRTGSLAWIADKPIEEAMGLAETI